MTQKISPVLALSPVQSVRMDGFTFFIKRDDLLNTHFSGNKARKFAYYLNNEFPAIKKIMCYGSVQANSLYSLAALAKLKNWQLDFYVQSIPQWLKAQPNGNYCAALALGANIIELEKNDLGKDNLDSFIRLKAQHLPSDTLFIPEGGRSKQAKQGVAVLAQEIKDFCQQQALLDPLIMLPSGTGTSAVFLQSLLPYKVLTCACVGNADYLSQQFSELDDNTSMWPIILPTRKRYQFGKLYPEFYQIWQQLKAQTGIEFDLLYDPLGWLTLLDYLKKNRLEKSVIYIHQGGLLGNQSMLPRYRRKYPS
ncbi:1-aminocyclopropane-1-carboxylate deaminase/D-cysteine desulfhydrase [Psychromonas antarctica]|uniref:1-aminocyclopropane-1-carboxylate deaminase/D-cysteine desulfhydrase n=1 Tax=Psychromonas antarctica TaxID=67573 RepID=UPI001EE8CC4C|nr:1-aminocyclopropane-1-carboxylate deaminase/D-cysteine desulfhydrase [Psychromonas antarctica]MCG6201422.1 1-aminocyclopropane-1-carboxylate deaminase/D-cysteine desulfhydrase [Psychromonas antarctica]